MHIPFNKPYLTGKEADYIRLAVESGKISGDGLFTKKCHSFFEETYGFRKVLLTTSCTAALEIAAMLIDIQPGDEVIMPSYTFVSTANAFVLRGAHIVFSDSCADNPNLDISAIEPLITKRTKAIVPVHYAGFCCDMKPLLELALRYNLYVIEDAAQAIDSYYQGKPAGSFGHLAAFSFHETKNIICGEGGMLVINDERFIKRAEIIREKGTNRSAFFRGEIDKYSWVDIGSSYLPSDILAAFLYAQLENKKPIQEKRILLWNMYMDSLKHLEAKKSIVLPSIPAGDTNNAHLFYLLCQNAEERDKLILFLKQMDINSVFHYLSLHKSTYYQDKHDGRTLAHADRYSDCLVRLPLFFGLTPEQVRLICRGISDFYK